MTLKFQLTLGGGDIEQRIFLPIVARRNWRFANASFDDGAWTLTVDGKRVPLETKPLKLLHELLLRGGELVTKDDLLDAIWPDVTVVDGSLSTAVLKLRRALGDSSPDHPIIETVRGVGYRLAVAIDAQLLPPPTDQIQDAAADETANAFAPRVATRPTLQMSHGVIIAIMVVVAFGGTMFWRGRSNAATATASATPETAVAHRIARQRDAREALRGMDLPRIRAMLRTGWSPNTPFDDQDNGAINIALEVCEWNPAHDQQALLMVVRTLLDGGAQLAHRNVWGDTAYSIARAPRYCGPDHPVTQMLHSQCYNGFNPPADDCLARYRPPAMR